MPTILVVNDDRASRYVLVRVLQQAGFAVREAASGSEALRLVDERPDAVVLDVRLPDLDGLEICRRIKRSPQTTSIPVVLLSAACWEEPDRRRGVESGGDAYLTGLLPADLLPTLRALLARQARTG
jgi:CheY-like chemotaxis protein